MRPLAFLTAFLFLTGCQSPKVEVVSLSTVVAGAHTAQERLVRDGVIQPDIAMQLEKTHHIFIMSDTVARDALAACKAGGPDSYRQAFAIASRDAQEYAGILLPYLAPLDAIAIRQRLAIANAP